MTAHKIFFYFFFFTEFKIHIFAKTEQMRWLLSSQHEMKTLNEVVFTNKFKDLQIEPHHFSFEFLPILEHLQCVLGSAVKKKKKKVSYIRIHSSVHSLIIYFMMRCVGKYIPFS